MTIFHRSKVKDDESSVVSEKDKISFAAMDQPEVKDRGRGADPSRFFMLVGASILIVLLAAALVTTTNKDISATTLKTAVVEETIPLTEKLQGKTPKLGSVSVTPNKMSYTERLNHPTVVQLRNCTVSFKASANMSFPPIWMPSYPASGAASASKKGDLLKPIIDKLTGWTAGSKNYHMSIRNKLKRCHAVNTPTAVCSNGHPLTSIGPEKQTNNFNSKVIMVLRNFLTAHPAMMQDKAFAYHGATEQVSKEEWKSSRDEWSKSSFETWKKFVYEWKSMSDYYHIDMYVVYEKLLDPSRGIDEVKRLAEQLQEAGLQTAPADQIPCIWYQAVEPEYRRLEHFFKYQPGYTIALKEFLTTEIEKFIHEMTGTDEELVTILNEYLDEIRNDITIDP